MLPKSIQFWSPILKEHWKRPTSWNYRRRITSSDCKKTTVILKNLCLFMLSYNPSPDNFPVTKLTLCTDLNTGSHSCPQSLATTPSTFCLYKIDYWLHHWHGIFQYLSFCDWLISVCLMSFKLHPRVFLFKEGFKVSTKFCFCIPRPMDTSAFGLLWLPEDGCPSTAVPVPVWDPTVLLSKYTLRSGIARSHGNSIFLLFLPYQLY